MSFWVVQFFKFYLYLSAGRYNFITDEKQFIEDILDAHNHFRYKHASGPLELDDDVSNYIFYLFFL